MFVGDFSCRRYCGSPGIRSTAPAQAFLSKVTEPLPSEDERQWFIDTLHALDHTIRLAEAIEESAKVDASLDGPDKRRAVKLYTDAHAKRG